MKRVPLQGVLPLGRKERVQNRQWRERAQGKKVRPGPGRPKSKGPVGVSHQMRQELRPRSALHVTLRVTNRVPNLRARRRYAVIRNAFVKFCKQEDLGFRLVHFAVLSNHVHFVVEADSKRALSMGMQKLNHSISRRLNALSLREHGQTQSTKAGDYSALPGWLGRVFSDRYFAHLLKTPSEIKNAIKYVRGNAERHYAHDARAALMGWVPPATWFNRPATRKGGKPPPDPCSSFGEDDARLIAKPENGLLKRILRAIARG